MDQQAQTDYRNKILSQKDLYEVLPFGKTKIQQLISSNQFPLLKIGKDYITTYNILEDWIREHINLFVLSHHSHHNVIVKNREYAYNILPK